jgi:AcrR family transcriptional regulator
MASNKAQMKRNLILDKAMEVFIQKGYTATSMEDLVQHSKVSKGSIYYHFDSKEDLFLSLLDKNTSEWWEAWEEKKLEYNYDFFQLIYGVAQYYVKDFQNPLFHVAQEFSLNHLIGSEEKLKRLIALMDVPKKAYTQIFEIGLEQGHIHGQSARELSLIFSSLMDGLSTVYLDQPEKDLESLYRKSVDVFVNGVLPR